jgi:coatomer subunit epsilon
MKEMHITGGNSRASAQESVLSTIQEWLADASCNSNPHVQLIAAVIFAQESNFVDALKICHSGATLEMCAGLSVPCIRCRYDAAMYLYRSALCVQMYLKMDRPDKAEQTVKVLV